MPLTRRRATAPSRPAMYNTPAIRTGGFGALQVEAVTNRPLSIARRHLAASQLRMRDIEPDELSSSQWVQFLVMEPRERDRWIADFARRRAERASSAGSSRCGSAGSEIRHDPELAYDKAQEAAAEARDAAARQQHPPSSPSPISPFSSPAAAPTGATPAVSLWVRAYDELVEPNSSDRAREPVSFDRGRSPPYDTLYAPPHHRPLHTRGVSDGGLIFGRGAGTSDAAVAPPTYESAIRARTPPPAYVPEDEDDLYGSS